MIRKRGGGERNEGEGRGKEGRKKWRRKKDLICLRSRIMFTLPLQGRRENGWKPENHRKPIRLLIELAKFGKFKHAPRGHANRGAASGN